MALIKVLLASRALESPPREGGFVLLSDLGRELAGQKAIKFYGFSATRQSQSGIAPVKVFNRPGWSLSLRLQFLLGLFKKASRFDIVHMAHIPTRLNVMLIKAATWRARRSGTRFVQTITGLPDTGINATDLAKLLWGDVIVCQSPSVYKKASRLRKDVALIAPWPPVSRVRLDAQRRARTRKKLFPQARKIVIFPGEFDRLGVDDSFASCVETFLDRCPDSLLVLACRFDKQGTAGNLLRRFPKGVVSVGETAEILPLLEAADLTIYPVRKMDSKFQPPLVLAESIQLGTPVLASSLIEQQAPKNLVVFQDADDGWEAFGRQMATMVNAAKTRPRTSSPKPFKDMVQSYARIYDQLEPRR